MKNLSILSVILILSSCAFHSGTISSNVPNEPMIHKDIAVGYSSTNIVLGFGGLSKDNLISQARKNMVLSRPLVGAEQYNNVEVNIKNTYYLIGRKTKVTINADVIEPKDSLTQATYSETYLNRIKSNDLDLELAMFSINDSVFIYGNNCPSGRITRFLENESSSLVEVSYRNSEGTLVTRNVKPNKLYLVKPEHMGLNILDRYKDGVILGFGNKNILIKSMYGIFTVAYPD